MKKIDLHIHTTFSDGTLTPEEVVKLAKENGLSAISITDHDGIRGVAIAEKIGKELGIEVVPGVEISAKRENRSVHILGYFIDLHNQKLNDFFQYMRDERMKKAEKMVIKLREHNIDIKMEDVLVYSGNGGIGRPHIAEVLIAKGVVRNFKDAFYRYLGDGKSCYVSKANVPTKSVIELINNAGGIAVLAHPSSGNVEEFIPEFVKEGIKGLEAYYPKYSKAKIQEYLDLTDKYNLVPTGGSDCHGDRGECIKIGEFWVEYDVLERLKRKASIDT